MPSLFRPCIDLHNGAVKQIVGGSLDTDNLRTNFVSESVLPAPFPPLGALIRLVQQKAERVLRRTVPREPAHGGPCHQTRSWKRRRRKECPPGMAE